MVQNEISKYIAELSRLYSARKATEHTYRFALQQMLETLVLGLVVTNEPKRIACGAPDYIATRGEVPVGYIEAKAVGVSLSDNAHKTQFDRYKRALDNLIITDYLTFQLFEKGEFVTSVTIASTDNNIIKANVAQFDAFVALINRFAGYDGQSIDNSEHFARVMATKARLLASTIDTVLNSDQTGGNNSLNGQLEGFQHSLIHDISHKEFADPYAQTIAYGMFAARLNDKSSEVFTRRKAAELVPHSNPFLRKLFQYVGGFDLDERIRWVVDDLADIFNYVDVDAIIKEFGNTERDLTIHFYETFLAEYDPALRKSRGVWYTPQPVVKFIVQAVDDILKTDFGLSQGLADASIVDSYCRGAQQRYHRVQVLDPATGTGMFLAEVVQNIYRRFRTQQGMWQNYVSEHLIPRINGFEILMASYAMAHLKIDMQLRQTGYQHSGSGRLRIYLTNSLEEAHAETNMLFARWLSDEANEASHIKQDVPVMVVLGNPPYSGESQNSGEWIDGLMNDYKKEPWGIRLQERNSKWINDDYVKFIRHGQYFIEKNGEGILAFVNNHSFLDNPTFRGMRYSLLKAFDKIYILDLHGNAKKNEKAQDGSKDENVFDIQQGVSINIFVKSRNPVPSNSFAVVYHAGLYGKRAEKYGFLMSNNLQTVQWQELKLSNPQFYFAPKVFSHQEEYEKGFGVQELFPVKGTGIVSKRDALAFQYTKKEINEIVKDIYQLSCDAIEDKYNRISWDSRDGKVGFCKNNVTKFGLNDRYFVQCNYRPFDMRWTYYTGEARGFLGWPVEKLMKHFLKGQNVGLVVCRQQKTNGFFHCMLHDKIVESSFVSNKTSEIGYSFPLYLYTSDNLHEKENRIPNFDLTIINKIAHRLELRFSNEPVEPTLADGQNVTFVPTDVMDYIYAVLHSPTYRERFKEILKIDFPRIPYPENAQQFWKLVSLGGKLRRLHLLDCVEPQEGLASFPVAGSNEVEKVKYVDNNVFINNTQYFENVPTAAWSFVVGGYQPAQKWLKDRKGRVLGYDDVLHYQKIVRVLRETLSVMREVDDTSSIIDLNR